MTFDLRFATYGSAHKYASTHLSLIDIIPVNFVKLIMAGLLEACRCGGGGGELPVAVVAEAPWAEPGWGRG